ncbi:MAG: hypothetical protein WCE75_08960 [Terracidiphilus sp.]
MPKLDNETIMLAFVIVTAAAVLLQTFLLLGIFLALRKTARNIQEQVEDLRSAIMPVIYNTRELYARFSEFYTRVAPQVEEATANVVAITGSLKNQSVRLQASAIDIMDRIRHQSARLDEMFTSLLDAIDRAGGFMAEMVSKPIRQIQGMLASVKAAIETLGQEVEHPAPPETEGRPTHAAAVYGPDPDSYL